MALVFAAVDDFVDTTNPEFGFPRSAQISARRRLLLGRIVIPCEAKRAGCVASELTTMTAPDLPLFVVHMLGVLNLLPLPVRFGLVGGIVALFQFLRYCLL